MGASSHEINREIRETRTELDQKLGILERRAASGAHRSARVVAGVAVGMLAVAVVAIAYRRRRQQAAFKRLFASIRDLPDDVTSKLKRRLPIKVVVTDKAYEEGIPGASAAIARKVAPSVVGPAIEAAVSRVVRRTPPDVAASE